jgi:serralysin
MAASRDRLSGLNSFDSWRDDNVQLQFARTFEPKAANATASPGAAIITPGPQALIDTVPGDTSSTATLTVGAAPVISAVDTIADQDFYRIELVAGHQYQIGMYGYTPAGPGDPAGPNGSPLLDSYLELYTAAGVLITSADGGSDTTINSANSGFDALLTFTATQSGTYYVNARAFDNIALDGDDGDMIGDYGLYAEDVTGDESLYTPYYAPNSPLYAIDWGTQVNRVHQSYRNPDGNEGTHQTGNPQAPVDPGAALGHAGKNVISIYFAQAGDIFVSNDPTNPGLPPATITATGVQGFEHLAVMTALHEFEKVADVVYIEVSDRAQADFIYTSYAGTPGPGVSLLGSMSPPDESDEGLAQFNSADYRWNATDLQQGGFSFVTLIHEFGHGHGLAHPHDNGGHSGIMNGVEPEGAGVADYTTGDYHLNQSVFTMMSYEDGWQDSPYGNAPTNVGYGYLGGLMAFDIAAIQDKYGVNEDWATGNDTYVLKDVNAAGTYFSSIWDGGGNDTIIYYGARDTTIDLRPATLQYEEGGGGRVSYANGIYGGFTVANGVTIERAFSGSGNDILIGNAADNLMIAGAGNDRLDGGLGRDTLAGQDGDDVLIGGAGLANEMSGGTGNDTYYTSVAGDTLVELAGEGRDTVRTGLSTYTLRDNFEDLTFEGSGNFAGTGNDLANVVIGGSARDSLVGLAGGDQLIGLAGDDSLFGGLGTANTLYGGTGNDTYYVTTQGDTIVELAGEGGDSVVTTLNEYVLRGEVENLFFNGAGNFTGVGSAKANYIQGGGGADLLNGGLGADTLVGNGGADLFLFDSALGGGNIDTLTGFQVGQDRILLEDSTFTGLSTGGLSAGAFATGSAATEADDRIIYNQATGALLFDADGVGGMAAVQFAQVDSGLTLSAASFVVI